MALHADTDHPAIPLIVLGMAAGGAAIIYDKLKQLPDTGDGTELAIIFLSSLILLPAFGYRANLENYPLDTPAWSLMFELLANMAYSIFIKYLSIRLLGLIVGICAFAMIYLSFLHNGVGFGPLRPEFFSGLVRVFFSFGFGVLIFRITDFRMVSRLPKISGIALTGILILSFIPWAMPFGWIYDIGCLFIVYPLIIICGATDTLPQRYVSLALLAGRLSYPLYILHVPVVVQHFGRFNGTSCLRLYGAIFLAMAIAVMIAWIVLKFYDEPIRLKLRGLFA